MFKKRESMSIKEFMNKDFNRKEYSVSKNTALFGTFLPLTVIPMTTLTSSVASASTTSTYQSTQTVAALSSDQIYDKMLTAFEPITTLIQALAYPVASICVLVGAIMIMVRQKDKGFDMITNAGLGVILINILPMLLNILVEIMKGIV
ncbi:hypothetical protein F0342_07040 [Bacillus sp. CH30_1T]|uniref:hypothetical protein n=1 Tax=Bacillus sp. CH30_1T TaxID=2604836 RepID=UPI0011EE03DD|nr:hypothetical protein [Bacillus sp. CH30_1T]KAA0565356.1 hypothetical protein F0342_07040 [Bacillus sp. CH30_1T]